MEVAMDILKVALVVSVLLSRSVVLNAIRLRLTGVALSDRPAISVIQIGYHLSVPQTTAKETE
jgi:hypothetical protein